MAKLFWDYNIRREPWSQCKLVDGEVLMNRGVENKGGTERKTDTDASCPSTDSDSEVNSDARPITLDQTTYSPPPPNYVRCGTDDV